MNTNINKISETAIEYISEHVSTFNPVIQSGDTKTPEQNRPFLMYLSYRAPHRVCVTDQILMISFTMKQTEMK